MLKLSVNDYQCEIQKDIAVTNLNRVNLLSKFMIVLELLVLLFIFIPLLRTSPDHLKWLFQSFIGLHSALLLIGILGFSVSSRHLKDLAAGQEATFKHKYMASIFLVLTLSVLAMITGLDQNLHNQATILFVAMVLSSVTFLIPFPKNIFTFGFPFIIFVMSILGLQNDSVTAMTHLINGSISFAAVVIISTLLYRHHHHDLSKKYELEEANYRLLHLAKHDHLTDLLQRSEFELQLESLMDENNSADNQTLQKESCLIFIDIDNFRQINQLHGYLTGDQVVRSVGKNLRETFPENALAARWAVQEFLIALPGTPGIECSDLLEALRSSFEKHPVPLENMQGPLYITISIGVAPLSGNYHPGFNDAFKKASEALSDAKRKGKNTIVYY